MLRIVCYLFTKAGKIKGGGLILHHGCILRRPKLVLHTGASKSNAVAVRLVVCSPYKNRPCTLTLRAPWFPVRPVPNIVVISAYIVLQCFIYGRARGGRGAEAAPRRPRSRCARARWDTRT